jgi:primosomal protein N' (replication factor Y)
VRRVAETDGQRVLDAVVGTGSVVLGPTPAAIAFLKGQHRWHLLIKAPSRGAAQQLLDILGAFKRQAGVSLAIDVDPATTG